MQGEASTRLGFTDYFRVKLAWAKLLGAVLLLAPVPAGTLIAAFNDASIPMVRGQIAVPTNTGQMFHQAATAEARRIWQTCVWEPLTRVKDRGRGAAAASLDDASEEEACAIAQTILVVAAMVQMTVESMGLHGPRE